MFSLFDMQILYSILYNTLFDYIRQVFQLNSTASPLLFSKISAYIQSLSSATNIKSFLLFTLNNRIYPLEYTLSVQTIALGVPKEGEWKWKTANTEM